MMKPTKEPLCCTLFSSRLTRSHSCCDAIRLTIQDNSPEPPPMLHLAYQAGNVNIKSNFRGHAQSNGRGVEDAAPYAPSGRTHRFNAPSRLDAEAACRGFYDRAPASSRGFVAASNYPPGLAGQTGYIEPLRLGCPGCIASFRDGRDKAANRSNS